MSRTVEGQPRCCIAASRGVGVGRGGVCATPSGSCTGRMHGPCRCVRSAFAERAPRGGQSGCSGEPKGASRQPGQGSHWRRMERRMVRRSAPASRRRLAQHTLADSAATCGCLVWPGRGDRNLARDRYMPTTAAQLLSAAVCPTGVALLARRLRRAVDLPIACLPIGCRLPDRAYVSVGISYGALEGPHRR